MVKHITYLCNDTVSNDYIVTLLARQIHWKPKNKNTVTRSHVQALEFFYTCSIHVIKKEVWGKSFFVQKIEIYGRYCDINICIGMKEPIIGSNWKLLNI